jgi:DNA-directed RNA polymerase subunit RPC12/RpoP
LKCPYCGNELIKIKYDPTFIKDGIPKNSINDYYFEKLTTHLDFRCEKCEGKHLPDYGFYYIYFPARDILFNYFSGRWNKIKQNMRKEKVMLT